MEIRDGSDNAKYKSSTSGSGGNEDTRAGAYSDTM